MTMMRTMVIKMVMVTVSMTMMGRMMLKSMTFRIDEGYGREQRHMAMVFSGGIDDDDNADDDG